MKIIFLDEFNEHLEEILSEKIQEWQREVERLLPGNPAPSTVKFDNKFLIEGHGTGGFADVGNVLVLAFQVDFPDKELQLERLRASYLHESYHLGQGWVGDVLLEPLAESILEGAATVFEREVAGTEPEWSKYYSDDSMIDLLNQVSQLNLDYDHQKWKYYDDQTGRSHLLYRLGTYICDEALKRNPNISIESLVDKTATQILELSRLRD